MRGIVHDTGLYREIHYEPSASQLTNFFTLVAVRVGFEPIGDKIHCDLYACD